MCRCTITKLQETSYIQGHIKVAVSYNPLDVSMSRTSLTVVVAEVLVFSLDLIASALFESYKFSFEEIL